MNSQDQQPGRHPLTDNWITTFGFLVAIVFFIAESIIILLDIFYGTHNPYIGILIYLVAPAFLIFGLLLIPLGMWREHRRRLRGIEHKALPIFDLNSPRHRVYLGIFVVGTTLFVILSMVGSYQAYHVTESTAFCGTVCHQVMLPEYTAYQNSPHARVDCVKCHIGPGANWYVKSKISGLYQVYSVLTKAYTLPIDTPIEALRPARDTCEECHWPDKFYQSIGKSIVAYAADEENTPYQVDMLLHVGGVTENESSHGIHWHIGLDHKLEYYPLDEDRQVIPWVRVTYKDGRVNEYVDESNSDFDVNKMDKERIREMDCIDCHNRPSHRYLSPIQALNAAMQAGAIDPKIANIKSILLDVMNEEYETTQQGLDAIQAVVLSNFEEKMKSDEALKQSVEKAIAKAKQIYQTNVFPEWNVNWKAYPWNIGHFQFPGCYRCHDSNHKSLDPEPKVISNDCALCHTIVRQAEGWDEIANMEYKEQKFYHPRGFGDDWEGQNCHECHSPDAM